MFKLLPMVFLLVAGLAGAEVYKWVDEDGRIHYGDAPRESDNATKVEVKINTYENVTYQSLGTFDFPEARNGRVIMYSTSWCGACKKARRYFKQNNIAFTEHDIEKSDKARKAYDRLNAKGVPVILYGRERMNGFSVSGFKRMYKKSQ